MYQSDKVELLFWTTCLYRRSKSDTLIHTLLSLSHQKERSTTSMKITEDKLLSLMKTWNLKEKPLGQNHVPILDAQYCLYTQQSGLL